MPGSVRPKPLVIVGVLLGALLLPAASAFAGNGGFAPVPPESPNAEGIHQSYLFISIFAFAIFLLVEGLLIAFVVRYRRRTRPRNQDGAQIHGASKLELAWTVGPVLILAVIATFVFVKLPTIQDVPAASAGNRNMVVDVTGTQFTWEFRYPNGAISIDRLRAPLGRTVELHVTAPDWDVIHSWWIPALAGKIDAIPGRVNKTWFKAQRTGVFQGQCAELCGLFHAKMLASVEVMPADEFDAWLEQSRQQQDAGTGPLGEEMWEATCAKCHGPSGEGDYGPKLAGTALVANPEAVEGVIRNGFGRMPPVGRDWNDNEMSAITTYLKENVGGG
jgi:cytochrome c oxidase, subunit II